MKQELLSSGQAIEVKDNVVPIKTGSRLPPRHVAIIMDGNNRWAKLHEVTSLEGHQKGAESAKNVIEQAMKLGIKYLTLYTFSIENWGRDDEQVSYLISLFNSYLTNEIDRLHENNIQVRFIGDFAKLTKETRDQINDAENLTRKNNGLYLTIAFSYGGRQEILNAVKRIANDFKDSLFSLREIDEQMFDKYLLTKDIPDPDLLIRTSGEYRISNFLLWQSAYTEFFFTPILWPDFAKENGLQLALEEFYKRHRRYGL